MILLERKSPKTGKMNSMLLNTTYEALDSYWRGEGFVQDIFPNLDENEREFIKTGYTQEDWDSIFPKEDFE